MVLIEKPKSLFGVFPYVYEQGILFSFLRDVHRGVIFIKPELVTLPPVITEFPIEELREHTIPERREKAEFFLGRAKKKLELLGV